MPLWFYSIDYTIYQNVKRLYFVNYILKMIKMLFRLLFKQIIWAKSKEFIILQMNDVLVFVHILSIVFNKEF